jgi:nickel-dependent lactate racemase
MTIIDLPYGNTSLRVEVPEAWLGEVAAPRPVVPVVDVSAEVRRALSEPVGSPPLQQMARPGQRVAILLDDYTRRTPIQQILPPVLEALLSAGVATQDIRLIVASGSHRPMSDSELLEKLGADLLQRFPVIQTAGDEAHMVDLGVTGNGILAWVHRAVLEADLRIGIGMITPHMDAGFSGGGKIILPGVCGQVTVNAFHARQADDSENRLGQVEAPLRLDLEQFVREQHLLDFVVNAILTLDDQLYQCVAGDFIAAHRVGVAYARQACGTPIKQRYPVVVASSYPHHHDLWQSLKGMWSGDLMTLEGGMLILATPLPEGLGGYPPLAQYLACTPDELHTGLKSNSLADPKSAATALMIQRRQQRLRICLVTNGLPRQEVERMGFGYYPSVEAALQQAVSRLPERSRSGSVGILTHGGILLPLISQIELK